MIDRITIRFIANIFEKEVQVIESDYEYKPVGEYFDQLIKLDRDGYRAIITGKTASWDDKPVAGDEIVFIQDISAFLAVLAPMIGAAIEFIAASKILMMIVGTLVSTLLGFVTSLLFSPNIPKDSFSNSPSYQWDGPKNLIGEGNPVPIIYGRHRVAGAIIEAWVDSGKREALTKRQYLNALIAVSEGEIEEIESSSIEMNNQPLSHFKNYLAHTRTGTLTQEALSGFSKIIRHYTLSGVEMRYHSAWKYTLNGDEIKYCEVTVGCPGLYDADDDEGKIKDADVKWDVWYAPYGSNDWVNVPGDFSNEYDRWNPSNNTTTHGTYYTWRFIDKTKSNVSYVVPITFPSSGRWKILFYRINENRWVRAADSTYITAVKEYENGKVNYPHTALLGLRLQANERISGAMPNISFTVKGRKLIDVRTGEPSETCDKNPANIVYDLLTHKRYGLGNSFGFTQAQVDHPQVDNYNDPNWGVREHIDVESLQDFANFCDELVTYKYYDPQNTNADVNGWVTVTNQKRYEFNLVVDSRIRALDLLTKILGTCRAQPYWEGSRFKVIIDREMEPVQLFSMGNIVFDSYQEDYINISDIPNVVECNMIDEANKFQKITIAGMDKARWQEPTVSKEVNLYGLTNIGRVKREITYAMNKAKHIRKFISFEAGMDAIVCQCGDVIAFQHNMPQYGMAGGRILTVTDVVDGSHIITLDSSVTFATATEYCFRVRNNATNTQHVYWITPGAGKTSTITLPSSAAVPWTAGCPYALGLGLNIAHGNIVHKATDGTNVVTIDASVSMVKGGQYSLRVLKGDGNLVVHTYTAESTGSTDDLTLNPGETLTFAEGDEYWFGEISKEAKLFRVTEIVHTGGDRKIKISAEEYSNSVYTDDHTIRVRNVKRKALDTVATYSVDTEGGTLEEGTVTLENELDEYSDSRYEVPAYLTDIELSEEISLTGDVFAPAIIVSFEEAESEHNSRIRIKRYDVFTSKDDGVTWHLEGSCTQSPYRIRNVETGMTYYVLVKPVTNYGITNDHEQEDDALDYSITILGDILDFPVPPPTDLTVAETPFALELSWTAPDYKAPACIEVWCADNQNDRTEAVKVAEVKGVTFSHGKLNPDHDYYYWIRTVNKTGRASIFCPGEDPEPDPPVYDNGIGGKLASWDGGTF